MPLIIPANTLSTGGYEVANSCRFNDGDAPKLERTFGTATNRKIWTLSMWVKRSSTNQAMLLSTNSAASYYQFQSGGAFEINDVPVSTYNYRLVTNAIYRDISAWMHIVIAFDSTQSTDSDRIKLYINGEQPSLSVATYPSQNFEPRVNNAEAIKFGSYDGSTDFALDAYLAEVVFIDGLQLAATSFGEFDSDSPTIWKPIDVSGLTFGTNGFWLDFEDSSALGNDVSGENNDFTPANLAATDQATDTPTNNFATWNPLTGSANLTYSEGNTKATSAGSGTPWRHATSSIAVASGKWYFEVKKGGSDAQLCSVADAESSTSNQDNDFNELIAYDSSDGNKRVGGTSSSYGDSYANGDIVGIALDMTNQFVYFSKNGTWQNSGDPTSGATGTGGISTSSYSLLYFDVAQSESHSVEANFGNPSFTVSSANQDANGYGNFEYAPPSGYYALCTKNLAEFG